MSWITRNQAAARIGAVVYNEPRSISLAKLLELVRLGKLIDRNFPSLGGRLMKHVIDEESVKKYIKEIAGDYGLTDRDRADQNSKTPVGIT